MINFLSIVALGFFLGMRHATDPDHVVAVSTIVSRQHNLKRSALIGAFWGVGHTLTIVLVGAAIILFNLVIPPRIGLSMEFSVALMLIVLGLMNLVSFRRSVSALASPVQEELPVVHSHSHNADDSHCTVARDNPLHANSAPMAYLDRAFGRVRLYQYIRPFLVGIVHGLAGSAAVALLVLTTIRNPYWAVAYLPIFGIGTIAGMMLITLSLASTMHFFGRSRRSSRFLAEASGVLSLALGLLVAYQIGFVDGLFTGHPSWTPRERVQTATSLAGELPMVRLSQNVQAFDAQPRSNVLVVSTRIQALFYIDRIRGIPPSDLFVQPYNRRTAPAIALGFTPLNAVTPNGLVGIFRSDHDFKNNGILVRTVNQAFRHVEFYAEHVVVVDKVDLAILDCSNSRRKQ